MAIADQELDAGASFGTEDLTAVIDADDNEELQVMGYAMSFTVGDFEVPRQHVLDRMQELGLPSWMAPRRPTPKSSYNRVRNRLVSEGGDRVEVVYDGRLRVGNITTKKVDKKTFQIDAELLYEADEIEDSESGEWITETLGKVVYNYDDQAVMLFPEIDSESQLWDTWTDYGSKALNEFDRYRDVHLGQEFQKLLNRLVNDWTNAVMMRDGGAYYFVPARHKDTLEKLATLFREFDTEFKDSGRRVEIKTIPVINDEQRREMVLREAEDEVEERVADALQEIDDELADAQSSDDTNVDEITDDVVAVFEEQLDEIDNFAAEYNALLEAELGVREILESKKPDVDLPEAEEIVEDVMN